MAKDIMRKIREQRDPYRGSATCGQSRNRLYGAIRAACQRLGIDEAERKDMQADLTGKASMSDMTLQELGQLLDHLNRDWKGPMGHRGHVAKIKALWWVLYWLGEVDEPGEKALSAFVRRQTGVSSLRFLDHRKAPAVIEALKSWAARAGVAWPGAENTAAIAACIPEFTAPLHERHAVLAALAAKLRLCGKLGEDINHNGYLADKLGLRTPPTSWTAHELDAGIRHLGRMLRRAQGSAVA